MAAFALPLLVASTAVSAVGSVMAGAQRSAAAQFESDQMKIQSEQAKTAAAEAEAQRRENLTSNIETIQAINAGRGIGANSPTSDAILTNYIQDAERDTVIERTNLLTKADLYRRGSIMAERKAKTSLIAGYMNAGSDILSTSYKYASGRV